MSTMTQYTPELIERFCAKVSTIPTEQGCLEWMAGRNLLGYGTFAVNRIARLAHRVAWEIANGPIYPGLVVRHFVCSNPRCVNVAHLRLGTMADNAQDRVMDRRRNASGAQKSRVRPVRPTIAERFYAKVSAVPNENGCLDWLACHNRKGYGTFQIGHTSVHAHRVAWEIANGPIPPGMWVLHRCDRPRCVNVEHLWLGSNADNVRDRDAKGRGAAIKGEKQSLAKLTEADVLKIRSGHFDGWFQSQIADHFGISQHTVWCILHRKTWKHI